MMMTKSRAYQPSLITKLGLLLIVSLLLNMQGLQAQNFEKKVAEITKGLYNKDGSPRSQQELINELKQTRYILTNSTLVNGYETYWGGFEYKTNENGEFSQLRALRKNGGNYFYQEMDYAFRGRTCYLEEANKRQGLVALGNGYVAQFTISDFLDPKNIDRASFRGTTLYADETAITMNGFATTPEQQAEFRYQLYLAIRKYIEGCQGASGKVQNAEGYTTSYTLNINDEEISIKNPDYAGTGRNNKTYMLAYNRIVDDRLEIYNVFPANPSDENPKIEYRSIPISSINQSLLNPFVESKYLFAVALYVQTVKPFKVISCLADGSQFTVKNESSANCEFNSDRFAAEYPSDAFRSKLLNSGYEMYKLSEEELAAKAERDANANIFDFGKSCNSDVSLLSLDGSTIFMMSTYGEDHIDVSDSDDEIYLYNDKAILKTKRGESVLFTRKNRDFYDATGTLVYTVKGYEIFNPSENEYLPAYSVGTEAIYKGSAYDNNRLCIQGIKSCTMVTMAYLFYFRP